MIAELAQYVYLFAWLSVCSCVFVENWFYEGVVL